MPLIQRLILQCAFCCGAALGFAAAPMEELQGPPLSSDIPAQALAQALSAFVDQTGLQLVYVSNLAEGRVSGAAPAGLAPARALQRLLAGTGMDFAVLNNRTVKLFQKQAAPASKMLTAARPPTPAAHLSAEFSALEEIVVTATKRAELLRDVPVSATVWSAAAMSEMHLNDIAEIAAITPGIEYDFNAQWGGGVLTNLAIRGIDSKVGSSTTGIYIDDAPIQARNGNFGNPYPITFDLARVEVLRGPQGTLFGAGAEGGAVRFITNDPSTTDYSALTRAEIGLTEYGAPSYEAGAAVGGPLVPGEVGARLAADYRENGGYIDRVDPLTGAPVDKNSNSSRTELIRLSLVAEPSDSLRLTPLIEYQALRSGDSSSFYAYLSNPADGILENGKLLSQPMEDYFGLARLKLELRLRGANLISATSYLDRTATATIDTSNEAGAIYFDGFGNPLGTAYPTSYADAVPTLTSLRQIVFAQEIRLVSAEADARTRWTLGLFYSNSRQDELQYTYLIATPAIPAVLSNEDYSDRLISGFGTLDIRMAPSLRARLGVRVDGVRSEFTQYSGGFANSGVPALAQNVTHETPVTPRFDLEYEGWANNLLYATVDKGFRIGGVNTPLPVQCGDTAVPGSYATDSLWNYETGAKLRSFDDRLQLAFSAFYLRWSNIQEHEVPTCGFGYVANAGSATGKGFDLTVDAALTERLTAGVAMESVDVRYNDTVFIDGKEIVDRGAVVGGVPHVPAPWNGTLYLRYQQPIGAGTYAYAHAEELIHSHNPGPFSELDPRSISYSPRYTADPATYQLNVQIGISGAHWDTTLFVNNAFNSLPVLQRNADAGDSSLIYAYTFRPRTVGITTNWKF
jgi:iron complex outermembrane receptor protein